VNQKQIILPHGFRSLCTGDVSWYDARFDGGHSNFRFVSEHYDSCNVIRRIFSCARKMEFNSFCVENVLPSTTLLQKENESLQLRNCGFPQSDVQRVSFFQTNIADARQGNILPEEYIGYVVIKKDVYSNLQSRFYVYESVLATLAPHRCAHVNTFLRCNRQYRVQYEFGEFDVVGSLYSQQNDLTFVCAHVALRSVLSLLLDNGDISYENINQLAGIAIKDGTIGMGAGGMKDTQLEDVLSKTDVTFRKIVIKPNKSTLQEVL